MADWDKNGIYILKALERIEAKLDKADEKFDMHAIADEKRFEHIEVITARLTQDVKWHARIAAGIGSAGALILSLILGHESSR